ncbi:hypothetical protein Tco_1152079, partial [Tanacetum coccineum]
MEQISSGLVCDRLSQLSSKYPWLISQCLEAKDHDTEDKFFCNIHGELPPYKCRIPQLLGTRIRGCFHGWVILSNHPHNVKWSLWNPVTSKTILLPHLILKDGDYDSIGQCCLSAPPNDPSSIILLTRTNRSTFVFCRVHSKRKKSRWIEMSYAKQLKRLTCDGEFVHSLTCCDGKVYALNTDAGYAQFVINVDIVVEDKEVAIRLMLFGAVPVPSFLRWGGDDVHYLKGSCTDLFYISIYSEEKAEKIPADVYLFKLDATCINWKEREYLKDWDIADFDYYDSENQGLDDYEKLEMSIKIWEEMDDLKGTIFFVDLARDHLVSYSSSISLELGGYIHIRGELGKTIYSCHVKDKTISLFPVPSPILPTSHVSMWESRLEDDHGAETKCIVDSNVEMQSNNPILLESSKDNGVELHESHLLNMPFNILEIIIENCVGVEYLNFRAACKQCHLAAPLIKWSNETSLRRLQMYSVVSPWLMVVNQKRGIITFTDPMLGESYYMENFDVSILEDVLCCSRFGWLLFVNVDSQRLVFFNPFTNELRNLSKVQQSLQSLCFSEPPTSADCMVVGFTTSGWDAHIHFVNREPTWHILYLGPHPHTIYFSTFYGRDLYTLSKEGELIVFNDLGKEDYSWKPVEAKAPNTCSGSSTQNFLTNCDQHLLLVSVSENGGHVTVFKRNDFKQEWEKVDGLGKHTIYICGTTCICLDAKMPQMENKIFFPQFHTKKKKKVFYSLDTSMYHTFDGNNIQEHLRDFLGTTLHSSPHAWIEPSWS